MGGVGYKTRVMVAWIVFATFGRSSNPKRHGKPSTRKNVGPLCALCVKVFESGLNPNTSIVAG